MINLLTINMLSIAETFNLPVAIGDITSVQWVIIFIGFIFTLLIIVKLWQKLIMFLLKLVLFSTIILVIYLLVVGW